MPNLFSLSVSSISATYSADFQNLSANYVRSLGTFTSDGQTYTQITGAYAPYTIVKLTPLGIGTNIWANSIDWIKFHFTDVYSPSAIQTTIVSFSTVGVSHVFGPPGIYAIAMTAHPSNTANPLSALPIAVITIGEIAAKPAFKVFDINGAPTTLGVSAYSPYTLQFAATGTRAGSYPLESLTWDFGDGTQRVVTLFETAVPDFDFLNLFADERDPRNYLATHTYYRLTSAQNAIFQPRLKTQSMVTATTATSASPLSAGPLSLARSEPRRLIKSKLFGPENNLLLISESDQGQVFQHVIKGLT